MNFVWDNSGDPDGNVHHILTRHPEMKSTRFIEQVFTTFSGDEDAYTSFRDGQPFLVIDKTFRKQLYRIVFEMEGAAIKIKTAHRITKHRS